MLIFRYLAKEVFLTLTALTTILMLIFMSNQFVRYLNRAVSGQFPLTVIMKLMMLEVPNLLGLLLPLGFYMSLLIAYGRMYADSEMTVLQACGYGPGKLLKHTYYMAGVVFLIVLSVMVWGSPKIAAARVKLIRTTGIQTLIQTVVPGHFTATSQGRQIFYIESMNRDHTEAQNIFLAHLEVKKDYTAQWKIVWAEKVFAKTDPQTGEDFLILQKGNEYEGTPGEANYQIADFEEYKARLPRPKMEAQDDIRTVKTSALWPFFNPDKRKAAELQWRLSVPLMVLTLTLIAVPLSRVNPRSGKFAKLLPAIIIYIIYANFLFVARDWMVSGKTSIALGLGWVHVSVLLLGLLLVWRNKVKLG
ncbi:MAG: LPS export ABC transporter permease LptF [Cyanobacteria bacterium]|nr:LPS export ABC transporter permease LptF [Cyanobacteriota bacterium]